MYLIILCIYIFHFFINKTNSLFIRCSKYAYKNILHGIYFDIVFLNSMIKQKKKKKVIKLKDLKFVYLFKF